jgi:hypothetical protein
MKDFVERFDFIICPQATQPYNCGMLSYNGEMQINFTRKIKEPELESKFYKALCKHNIPVKVESN